MHYTRLALMMLAVVTCALLTACDAIVEFDVVNDLQVPVTATVLYSNRAPTRLTLLPGDKKAFGAVTGAPPWNGTVQAANRDGVVVYSQRWRIERSPFKERCTIHIVERVAPDERAQPTCVEVAQATPTK